jgi:hypothetical protein
MDFLKSHTYIMFLCRYPIVGLSSLMLPLFLNINKAGSDSETLARLKDFGLCEHHAQAVYGGIPRKIKLHGEWLGARQVIERENQGRAAAA